MSNTAFIQQETVIIRHSGEQRKHIAVFDDYASEYVEQDEFVESNVELLRTVIRHAKSDKFATITAIIDHVFEHEKGINVEGIYHRWEDVREILTEEGYGNL